MTPPRIEMMAVGSIFVGPRHRTPTDAAVSMLAESIKQHGLQQPITVRLVNDAVIDGEVWENAAYLVAGAHRLAACKQLGWTEIPCIEVTADDLKAEMLEITENLHRCDLTKEERDRQIRRYAELLEARKAAEAQSRQNVAIESRREDGKGHRPKGVASQIAEETGLNVRTVQRVLNPVPPSPKPQPPARDPFNEYEATERQVDALMRAWNAAGKEARERFLGRIEQPVFEQTRAGAA